VTAEEKLTQRLTETVGYTATEQRTSTSNKENFILLINNNDKNNREQ